MTDIYDIKDILLGFPINITYSIIYLLFIVFLYLFYKNFINKKIEKPLVEYNSVILKEEKDFIKIIKDFEGKYLDSQKDIFYSGILEILREILENSGNKNISKMTFEELNKLNLNDELKSLIKSIYYKEYSKQIEDNKEVRLSYVKQIIKLVK